MKQNLLIKISFFMLSMALFFVIVLILGTDIPISFSEDAKFVGLWSCLTNRGIMLPIVCTLALLYIVFFISYLKHRMKGTTLGPIEITDIQNANNDILAFVGTYFLPLVSFSLAEHWQHLLVLFILFVVIGVIYVRADIYYTNPTLLLLGFRVYRIKGNLNGDPIERVVIVQGELKKDVSLRYIVIDDNTYFVKEIK